MWARRSLNTNVGEARVCRELARWQQHSGEMHVSSGDVGHVDIGDQQSRVTWGRRLWQEGSQQAGWVTEEISANFQEKGLPAKERR